jgi:endonuclease/exonuclease/phosphatase family metal-dependent hydrolase
MFAYFENLLRILRRRVSRNEWIIALLGLPVSKGDDRPGLVLIQIDGLSRKQLERAIRSGRMPFLRRLQKRENYHLQTFYSGLPSSTPAVQAEILYGVRSAVPAFTFLNRTAKKVFAMFNPDCAREIEKEISEGQEGLLAGGSSWCNIYSGGAATDESHFCASRLGLGDVFRSRRLIQALTFPLLHFSSLVRLIMNIFAEFSVAIGDFFRGLSHGESFGIEIRTLFARVFACVALREILTIGVSIDVARGLPVIHANFFGYDIQSHRRGPSSTFAHWSLKGIDRAIRKIYRAAQRSGRREYQVWIFSDHGQERTDLFNSNGRLLDDIVRSSLDGFDATAQPPVKTRCGPPPRVHILRRGDWITEGYQQIEGYDDKQWFSVAAMGPLGHLYLIDPRARAQKMKLAERLIREGIPGVIVQDDKGKWEWLYDDHRLALPAEAISALPHPPAIKDELVRDLVGLCGQKYAGDIILLGWSPGKPASTFVDEHGSHAGIGPEETQGFALLPPSTILPREGDFLRPSELRAAALHFMQRRLLPPRAVAINGKTKRLRVMTYNVHGCRGMDGRISPTRIARIIQQYRPDLVALQELDFGRVRSQQHHQPELIASELGMQVQFCPTITGNNEQYGHALLSREPMKVVRTAIFDAGPRRRVEPRGALWVRVEISGLTIHLMNTHFGLWPKERSAQADELLGENWIGKIAPHEPAILCGDFNMFPRSQPYRAITRRLRDAQSSNGRVRPRKTYSTFHPFSRIDHVFISQHFEVENILVPRNDLTRVASDHLPLIVDLCYK